MMSVALAGAGGSARLSIVDFQLPIGRRVRSQSKIGNWHSAIERPTRYREVVLTSSTSESKRRACPCRAAGRLESAFKILPVKEIIEITKQAQLSPVS